MQSQLIAQPGLGLQPQTQLPAGAPATASHEWSEGPQASAPQVELELPPDELQLSQAAQHDLTPTAHGEEHSDTGDSSSTSWSPEASSVHDEMSGLQRSLQAALKSGNKTIAGKLMSRLAQCQSEFASLTGS